MRRVALIAVVSAAFAFAAPANAAPQQLTYRYGPITLGPYEVDQNTILGNVPKPNVDGFITHMEVDLVDKTGTRSRRPRDAAPHRVPEPRAAGEVRQHHDWTCNVFTTLNSSLKVPALADRFYASGEERNTLALPDGYGYPVKGDDNWVLLWMLMNHHAVTDKVYIQYKITYETERQLTPAYMVWLDVENCLQDPVFDVPGGGAPGSTYSRSVTWTAPMAGRIVAGGGHVHGGGKSTVLSSPTAATASSSLRGRSTALPNDPVYLARPVMHEPGPINMSGFLSPQGLPLAKGQRLKLTANYDNRYPHTRVMGIFGAYFVPDPSGDRRLRAAARRSELTPQHAPGRRDPPASRSRSPAEPAGRVRNLPAWRDDRVSDFRFDKSGSASRGALAALEVRRLDLARRHRGERAARRSRRRTWTAGAYSARSSRCQAPTASTARSTRPRWSRRSGSRDVEPRPEWSCSGGRAVPRGRRRSKTFVPPSLKRGSIPKPS